MTQAAERPEVLATPLRLTASARPTPGIDVSRPGLARLPFIHDIKIARSRLRFARDPQSSPMRLFAPSRTIFVRVPKNASTSIAALLYPDTPTEWLPHYGADFYRRVFPAAFAEYLVFAPLRDPLERFVSAFTYYREKTTVPEERRLMDEELPFIKTLEDFVLWLNDQDDPGATKIMRWDHFRPQRDYICDGAGRVITDLLFPVDDMGPGMELLGRHVGCDPEVPQLNRSRRQGFADLPLDRIRAHYAVDLELWDKLKAARLLLPTDKAHDLGLTG